MRRRGSLRDRSEIALRVGDGSPARADRALIGGPGAVYTAGALQQRVVGPGQRDIQAAVPDHTDLPEGVADDGQCSLVKVAPSELVRSEEHTSELQSLRH